MKACNNVPFVIVIEWLRLKVYPLNYQKKKKKNCKIKLLHRAIFKSIALDPYGDCYVFPFALII
jgi:hypothetical protein